MPEKTVAPYGSWKSPITSEAIAAGAMRIGDVVDGDAVYWTESRPQEGGRQTIVRRGPDGKLEELLPAPFNARTRVHEYGGGSFAVADGTVYFSNFADQRLYRVRSGEAPTAITPEGSLRYADGVVDRARNRLICVVEDHSAGGHEPANRIAAIDLATGAATTLVEGADFYSNPRISPNGQRLSWMSWRHPNMPWDGSELWIGEVDARGAIYFSERVAGGPSESIYGPLWSPTGYLHYVSDRTGWWNLYRWLRGTAIPLWRVQAELGQPQWVFGTATFGFESADRIICTYRERGESRLARLDTATGKVEPIESPYTDVSDLRVANGRLILKAGSPTESTSLVQVDLATGATEVLSRSSKQEIDPGYLSAPESIEFPTTGGRTAFGFYYPPRNRDVEAPAGERPPLLVKSHGGPTGATTSTFSMSIQFWTSRGIGVLDVNYGGSTGYGRAYRERLDDAWGIVDVDDCVAGARYLVERGDVDPARLLIDGGSAGGYTTLAVLTFRDQFKAGASYYGVSDLEALATDTHKFESRYLDRLVGPYPARREVYTERSPIHHVDQLACPIVFFQGLEDKVVPPDQAERMVEALKQKGLPVAYVPYEGEQHGFRRAENIKRSLDVELYFYSKVLGFPLADQIEPVEIANLRGG
jgi:dipeptidyl aminopeptidase/acylaminoacyl peptidase